MSRIAILVCGAFGGMIGIEAGEQRQGSETTYFPFGRALARPWNDTPSTHVSCLSVSGEVCMEATLTSTPVKTREVARRETMALIASDKVEGTAVYRSNGEKIGRIENAMINKRSAQVAYAAMTFGGVLGLGSQRAAFSAALVAAHLQPGSRRLRSQRIRPHARESAPLRCRCELELGRSRKQPKSPKALQSHFHLSPSGGYARQNPRASWSRDGGTQPYGR